MATGSKQYVNCVVMSCMSSVAAPVGPWWVADRASLIRGPRSLTDRKLGKVEATELIR
jgi:hypothetical protein